MRTLPDTAAAPQAPAAAWPWRRPLDIARRMALAAEPACRVWLARPAAQRPEALARLRRQLRHQGLTPALSAKALGLVCATAQQQLGQAPRATQVLAAAVLLNQHLAEMATGEGKTLALALAAAVAALAGVPVHVVTANDYLATRDARNLAPLYQALGLRVAALPPRTATGATAHGSPGSPGSPSGPGSPAQAAANPTTDDADRRAAYQHEVLYATARDLAFDFLRDQLASGQRSALQRHADQLAGAGPTPPLMRGLCMALVDELDSSLLDEAEVPLVLSHAAPQAARRAFLWQALALARQLQPAQDFVPQPGLQHAVLTAAGQARLQALCSSLGGPWRRTRYRHEAVQTALTALHNCQRGVHYLVRDGSVQLIDEVTGRTAEGRMWSRGLHTVVALKEGLAPPPETDTLAQTTYQRFFQRYWRVAGLSGTLHEGRAELRQVLGARVLRIPLQVPSRLQQWPMRVFHDPPARWSAVCARVAALRSAGRPVLVGTDSVADSEALSQALQAAGLPHRVLNALHHADEADTVARAGQAGSVTVATRMAGRGTDIALDAAARAAGGLHVLSCQHNPSRRLDRQLAGRAGRQGDPGSAETWLLSTSSTLCSAAPTPNLPRWTSTLAAALTAPITALRHVTAQGRAERQRAALRRALLQQDLHWEQRLAFAGPTALKAPLSGTTGAASPRCATAAARPA